jgi:GNAT superfamily N-acetyltransferase
MSKRRIPLKKQGPIQRPIAEITREADNVQKYFQKVWRILKTKHAIQRQGNSVLIQFHGKPVVVPEKAHYSGYPSEFRFMNAYIGPNNQLLILREMHEEPFPGSHRAIFMANVWEGGREIYIGYMDRHYSTAKGKEGIEPFGGVMVKPEYRRQGIGTLLDYLSKRLLRSRGITKFEVTVDHTPAAEPFAKFTGKIIKKKQSV